MNAATVVEVVTSFVTIFLAAITAAVYRATFCKVTRNLAKVHIHFNGIPSPGEHKRWNYKQFV